MGNTNRKLSASDKRAISDILGVPEDKFPFPALIEFLEGVRSEFQTLESLERQTTIRVAKRFDELLASAKTLETGLAEIRNFSRKHEDYGGDDWKFSEESLDFRERHDATRHFLRAGYGGNALGHLQKQAQALAEIIEPLTVTTKTLADRLKKPGRPSTKMFLDGAIEALVWVYEKATGRAAVSSKEGEFCGFVRIVLKLEDPSTAVARVRRALKNPDSQMSRRRRSQIRVWPE